MNNARTAIGAPAPRLRRLPGGAAGVTLVELLIVIVLAGVLVSMAIPSFRYVTTANRVAGEINGLLGDMQLARAEAIKEGQTVSICSSINGTSCSGATAWATGWIIFMDANGNKTVDAGETVLRVQTPFTGTTADTLDADNATSAVTFNREGYTRGLPGTVTLKLHEPTGRNAWKRCLAVSIVGQLQIQTYGTGNCT